jgi:acetyl-CoA acyltransferase
MEVYIIKAFRSPVGKAGRGVFKNYRSDDLAINVIQHLLHQVPELDTKIIDDVIVGCANPEGEQGLQIGRMISLNAVGMDCPGMTINRYCASGLESIAIASAKIKAGLGHCYLAGGTESMSSIPMTGYKLAPNYRIAKDTPDYIIGMGLTAEAVAQKYCISREDQDAFALRSHTNAAKAQDNGNFDNEIVPISFKEVIVSNDERKEIEITVTQDEGIRRDSSMEALAKLRPAFQVKGSVTAGNSSQTSDGASFALVMSGEMMNKLNLSPIARFVSCAVAGVDPLYMGIGPVKAIPKALKIANLELSDIGLIELNEAFSAQSLAVIREAGLNVDIVNVNGGAIALGHPLGCSGAKLTTTLINEMHKRDVQYGMVTACVGGGQGIAGIFEKIS